MFETAHKLHEIVVAQIYGVSTTTEISDSLGVSVSDRQTVVWIVWRSLSHFHLQYLASTQTRSTAERTLGLRFLLVPCVWCDEPRIHTVHGLVSPM